MPPTQTTEVKAAEVKAAEVKAAVKCGKPALFKSKGKETAKPCVKDTGHAGNCSAREYKPVDTSVISLAEITVESFAEGERITVLTDPGTRSDIQKRIDADVATAFAQWKDHGMPDTLKAALAARFAKTGDDGRPVTDADGRAVQETVAKRYWVNPSQEAAWRKMLRSAATINGIQVRIYPVQKHVSGRYQLPWFARTMRERNPKAAAK